MISIFYLLLMLAVLGFVTWLITEKIPMPDVFKQTIIVVVVVLVCLYILGILSGAMPLPQLPAFRS